MPPLLLLVAAATLAADTPTAVYHGFRAETRVDVPRLDAEVTIDGRLDEAAWARAAVLTGFSQYAPVDGLPAEDSTEVLVWYSADAIHFGVRAFDRGGAVNARLADRDRIDADDHVQILLDTFDDARRALVFGVNPLGVQADGVRQEGSGGGGGAFSAEQQEDAVDLSPDFLWTSRGRVTDGGWQVELRIPFKSLRYSSDEVQDWGINVLRRVQRTGHLQTWSPARRGRASFLGQSGKLQGLRGLDRGLVLDVNPVATARLDGAPAGNGWDYSRGGPELGANVRWGMTENLTLNGTVNPDFSQVEADAGQLIYDPRQAQFFAEKRPFFLEGSEQFQVPNNLVYTRRIVGPVGAAKLTGKVGGTDVGVLAAVDDDAWGTTGDNPVFGIVRLRRDVGAGSNLGLVYTDRTEGGLYNRVAAADTRLLFGGIYTLAAQAGASFDSRRRDGSASPLIQIDAERSGRRFGVGLEFSAIDDQFVAGSGFLSRNGLVVAGLRPRLTFFGAEGARVESFSTGFRFSTEWLYDNFWEDRGPDDLRLFFNNNVRLRGGWALGATLILESFNYPFFLYGDYALERAGPLGTDTLPFTGGGRLQNTDLSLRLSTPEWERFAADANVILGRDDNFDEWSAADIVIADATLAWRPTDQIRTEFRWAHQRYLRVTDGTTVRTRDFPRLKVEYQLSRAIFLRFVGQYAAIYRDALHDDGRTGLPILIRGPDGVYARALEERDNELRADWLFSYQPSPGTVIFAGYGGTLVEERSFDFTGLERTNDGFFVKVSYLFRL